LAPDFAHPETICQMWSVLDFHLLHLLPLVLVGRRDPALQLPFLFILGRTLLQTLFSALLGFDESDEGILVFSFVCVVDRFAFSNQSQCAVKILFRQPVVPGKAAGAELLLSKSVYVGF
jgi:hypothetical protein